MSWRQPICNTCWAARYPGAHAVRVVSADLERCCFCGRDTRSGIYVRVEPGTVPYPTTSR